MIEAMFAEELRKKTLSFQCLLFCLLGALLGL